MITGASSGIGAATALACARVGMDSVLTARRADRLQEVAEQVKELGRSAEVVVGDVTDDGLSSRLLDAARERFGRFDAVFANAGYGHGGPMHELDDADLRRIFDVNFFAAMDLLREATRRLTAEKRRGHLLMCASTLSKFALPTGGAYAATKAAQSQVCESMRLELRPRGIHVSSVHPITTRTEFFTVAARISGRSEKAVGAPARGGRLGVQTAEQVAKAVVACLRRPKPEVWPSKLGWVVGGLISTFPGILDFAARFRRQC